MCPTTSLHISPRCYPIVADLEKVKRLNFCAFIAYLIKASLGDSNKKKAVNCCAPYGLLYVESLVVDILVLDCAVRAEAWDNKRIGQVAKTDRNPEGGYGKLRRKPRYTSIRCTNGLFVGYEETDKFVFSKLPPTFKRSKKRKINAMVSTMCSDFSGRMGIFIEEIDNLDRKDAKNSRTNRQRTKRRRAGHVSGTRIEESEHDGGIL